MSALVRQAATEKAGEVLVGETRDEVGEKQNGCASGARCLNASETINILRTENETNRREMRAGREAMVEA